MSEFKKIVAYQKSKKKGNIRALTTASGQRILEKVDPRNYIFDRQGLLATLFPKVKGYQAKTQVRTPHNQPVTPDFSGVESQLNNISNKLTTIEKVITKTNNILDIFGKNSMSLPQIAQDLNIIRQGIIKLVKLGGEEQSNKTDMFFKKASENEQAYESKFNKKEETPSKVIQETPKEEDGPFLTLFKGVVGGGILAGLAEYFTNDDFKKKVDDILGSIKESLFGDPTKSIIENGFDSILKGIGSLLENHWKEISIGLVGLGVLLNPAGTLSLGIQAVSGLFSLLGSAGGPIALATGAIYGMYKAAQKFSNTYSGVEGLDLGDQELTEEQKLIKEKSDQRRIDEARIEAIQTGQAKNIQPGELESLKTKIAQENLAETNNLLKTTPNPEQKESLKAESLKRQREVEETKIPTLQPDSRKIKIENETPSKWNFKNFFNGFKSTEPEKVDSKKIESNSPEKNSKVPSNSQNKEEFINKYKAAAEKAGKELGVSSSSILTQWGLETGWGKSIIPGTNNLGNIKDFSGNGVKAYDKAEGSYDAYKIFNTTDDFVDYYVKMIKRKYPEVINSGEDISKFAEGLQNGTQGAKYATDPKYKEKLIASSKGISTDNKVLPVNNQPEVIAKSTEKSTEVSPGNKETQGLFAKLSQGMWGNRSGTGGSLKEGYNDLSKIQSKPQPPIIISQNQQTPQQKQSIGSIASVVDKDFMRLLLGKSLGEVSVIT